MTDRTFWQPSGNAEPNIRLTGQMNEPFFQILPNSTASFMVQDYVGRRRLQAPGMPRPTERCFFTIVDHNDGQTKVLSLGKEASEQLMRLILQPILPPRRNWFMRLLEWLHIIKPLPIKQHEEFEITRTDEAGWPRYSVRATD